MHYEEKVSRGQVVCRSTPNGVWLEVSRARYIQLAIMGIQVHRSLEKLIDKQKE